MKIGYARVSTQDQNLYLQPSPRDIAITEQLIEGGKILGIQVLDHLIVTTNGYMSFGHRGMI